MNIKTIEGNFVAQKDKKIFIVASKFNDFIVNKLIDGAIDTLIRHGFTETQITIVKVPGAFELPLAIQKTITKADAIIALGTIIRGGTPHFDYVASECTKGIASVSLQANIPVAFGVLTVDSIEQAIERAGTKMGNKGIEAAMSAIEMLSLMTELDAL